MKKSSKFKVQSSKFGFTLIELLISIGLFATITTVIISVLFTSFRASKKAEVIVAVKETGTSVLSRIVSGVRYARRLDDPVSCVPFVEQSSITLTSYDGGQTTYYCPDEIAGIWTISSNSAELVNTSVASVVENSCSFTCSQETPSDAPTITIKFDLSAARATDFVETSSTIPFQTSVIMRNFTR